MCYDWIVTVVMLFSFAGYNMTMTMTPSKINLLLAPHMINQVVLVT